MERYQGQYQRGWRTEVEDSKGQRQHKEDTLTHGGQRQDSRRGSCLRSDQTPPATTGDRKIVRSATGAEGRKGRDLVLTHL